MNFKKIQASDITFFLHLLGEDRVKLDANSLAIYGRDYTEDLQFSPDIVLLPSSKEQIVSIMKHCYAEHICVYARGAGTSLSGGPLPVYGGVSLSLERMNRILHIDPQNMQATVEPGVINEELQLALDSHGLMYGPDPASKGTCTLGGNVAHNSGGPRALKYGTTRENVLNLQVVLANGECITTGANTLKNSTGYSLTQLMIGSEGTLGIVTQITVKLHPKQASRILLLCHWQSFALACAAVSPIMQLGILPSALELMEASAVQASVDFLHILSPLAADIEALMIVELEGPDIAGLELQAEQVYQCLSELGCHNIQLASTHEEQERVWKMRRVCGEAVKARSSYKEEDTVVPRASLPILYQEVKRIGAKYGFESVCYGHAGDGNLHINILRGALDEHQWTNTVKLGVREIFEVCHQLGGTLSGEHGVGWVQKEYLNTVIGAQELSLMKAIKQAFDPTGILNPGKIFPA